MKNTGAHLLYFLKLWLFMLLSFALMKGIVLPALPLDPASAPGWEYALLPLGQGLLFWLAMHLSDRRREARRS